MSNQIPKPPRKGNPALGIAIVLGIIVVFVVCIGGCSAIVATSSAKPSPVATQGATGTTGAPGGVSTAKPPVAPVDDGLKGWKVNGKVRILKGYGGDFSGTLRMTNKNDSIQSATFGVTLFSGTETVGTMVGLANEVNPGLTATVNLISTDPWVKFDRVEVQVNSSF